MHSAALAGSSTNFDRIWCARSLAPQSPHCTTVAAVTKLHARAAVLTGLNLFYVQFHHAFVMCHQTACTRCCTDRFKLARQPCPAALPGSLGWQFDQFRPDLMRALARSAVTALYYSSSCHQTACARCCPDRFKLFLCPISPCFHYVSPNSMHALLYWQV
jgi:hypothetical protein